jgi:hypothetical protein
MDNNRETQTFDDRGGFTAHPDNPVYLTWDAAERTWMTHQKAGATVFEVKFPASWNFHEVKAEFMAEEAVKETARREAYWTAECKRVREL